MVEIGEEVDVVVVEGVVFSNLESWDFKMMLLDGEKKLIRVVELIIIDVING